MNIKPVSNNYSYNNGGLEGKKGKESAGESKIEDKLEISEKAKALNKGNQAKKLALIKDRLNNNFYNSDEVTKKVSQEIFKEIKASK